jgi:hypothetical protein
METALLDNYHHALHAIAHHNLFGHDVKLETHPLSCLLRLCDEIQDWDRKRINIERIVKNLYIAIDQNNLDSTGGRESLKQFVVNLTIERSNSPDRICIGTLDDQPRFNFQIAYENPTVGGFDTTTTFLSKAYNLQHVDLDIPKIEKRKALSWNLDLWFPQPEEYQAMGLCETDIYTHFIQEVRELPELSIVAPVSRHSGGLFVREPNNKDWPFADHASQGRLSPLKRKGLMNLMDRIGIVVAGSADHRNRVGWLNLDPSELFKPFIKFKEKLFLERKQRIIDSSGHA